MRKRAVWILDPDPAFRKAATKSLKKAGVRVAGLKEAGQDPPWEGNDVLIASVDLLPVDAPPAVVIALVPAGDGPSQATALQSGADWCLPRDPSWIPHLSAIIEGVHPRESWLALGTAYQRMLEQVDVGVVIQNAEGNMTFVNSRAAEMLSRRLKDLLSQPYTEIVHPDCLDQVTAAAAKYPEGVASQYEIQLLCGDGSTLTVWGIEIPLSERGKPVGVLLMFRDVSRERHVQRHFDALQKVAAVVGRTQDLPSIFRQAEQALLVAIEGSQDAIVLISDEDGRTLRPVITEPDHPASKNLSRLLDIPLPQMRLPLSMLPAEWARRIPRGRPCVSLNAVELVSETLGAEAGDVVARETNVSGVVVLPMRSGGLLRGMIVVTLKRPHINEKDLDLATALASLVGTALESIDVMEHALNRMHSLERLFELAQAMAASTELVELADIAARQFIKAFGVEEVALSLWDREQDLLRTAVDLVYDYENDSFSSWTGATVYPLEDYPATRKVMADRHALQIHYSDPGADPHELAYMESASLRTLTILPLTHGEECVGVVELGHLSKETELSRPEINEASRLVEQIAVALEEAGVLGQGQQRASQLDSVAEIANQFVRAFGAEEVSVSLWNRGEDTLETLVEYYEITDEFLRGGGPIYRLDDFPATRSVMGSQQPLQILISDHDGDARELNFMRRSGMRMLVILPLVHKGECIGVVELADSIKERRFARDELVLAMTLSGQVAAALESARLFAEAQRRAIQLGTAADVARQATSTLDIDALLSQTVNLIQQRFGFYHAVIFLLDMEGAEAVLQAATGKAGQEMLEEGYILPVGPESIVGTVAAEGEPWISNDVRRDSRHLSYPLLSATRSELGLPLQVHGKVIGVLDVQSTQAGAFSADVVSTLQTLADQVASAIENASLYEQERRRANQASLLNVVAQQTNAILSPEQLLPAVAKAIHQHFDYDSVALLLVDRTHGDFVVAGKAGEAVDTFPEHYRQAIDKGIIGWVATRGEPLLANDTSQEERYITAIPERYRAGSELAVPLRISGETVGVLDLQCQETNAFDELDVATAQTLAEQVAVALQNAQLYQDVTEHAAGLEKAYSRLREADQLKDEMIQNVSHELRTPMTFIKSYVELLLDGELGPLTEGQQKALDVMARKGEHLARMVGEIVTLETVRRETLETTQIDLGQLARNALEDCHPAAAEAGVELRDEIPERLPLVRGDRLRLSEVFDNLLSNAIKFSPDGGMVTVRVTEELDYLRAEVTDTGIGIPPEKLPRVFERFYQVDGSTKRRFGGAGLGLAIVQRIVEAHGGDVGVTSEPEKGSTFYFTIPKGTE